MKPTSTPFKTAYHPDIGLHIPLYHLLGNKIGINLEDPEGVLTGRRLNISAWKFKNKDEYGEHYRGRFHIAPVGLAKIKLIEDLNRTDPIPRDFPYIFERTTEKDLVNTSLFYPLSKEIWNYQIHLNYTPEVNDHECKILMEETLTAREAWTGWHSLERVDYTKKEKKSSDNSKR